MGSTGKLLLTTALAKVLRMAGGIGHPASTTKRRQVSRLTGKVKSTAISFPCSSRLLLQCDLIYFFFTLRSVARIEGKASPMGSARKTETKLPFGVLLGGATFRTLFIIALAILTARVASPQIEDIWSVFETPDDFIRVVLGFTLVAWCIVNLFILPKDAEAYRTWLYLGLAVLPLALLCAFVVW